MSLSLSLSSSSSGENAVEKELPTFRIGRFENHRFSAAELANILYRHTDISNGFICGRMAYMSHYRDTYKFASVKELQQAIEQYCKENDTSTFDFSEFHIYFAAGSYLKEITIEVNRDDRRRLLKRGLQSVVRAGSSDAAAVYRRLFSGDGDEEQGKQAQQVRGVEPAMCYLPPYYDDAGDHVGGGMPDVVYPNFKTNPRAYGHK